MAQVLATAGAGQDLFQAQSLCPKTLNPKTLDPAPGSAHLILNTAQVLATAGAGRDPFQAQPPPMRPRRAPPAPAEDPDLEAVGQLLEGARLYVLSALFVAGHAASLVLIKVQRLQDFWL